MMSSIHETIWFNSDKDVWKEMKKEFKQFIKELGFKYQDSWKSKNFMVRYANKDEMLQLTITWEEEQLKIDYRGKSDNVQEELDSFLVSFDFLKITE